MKRPFRYIVPLFLCISLVAAERPQSVKRSSSRQSAKDSDTQQSSSPDGPAGAKIILYGENDVVRIKAKVRYSSLIILPKTERILDYTCGDKEFWVINGSQNFAYVKPAKPGSQTNLNLVTASGNVYSFLLTEVSDVSGEEPDLKVFIQPNEDSMISAAGGPPQFVAARDIADCRREVEQAKEEARQTKADAQSAIDTGITTFVANMRFPYRFEAGKKPFYVRAMYNDDKFTYIQARPEETPTLYEVKDKQPSLVNFEYKNGVYVVDKILDQGYLAIGKQKLAFKRED